MMRHGWLEQRPPSVVADVLMALLAIPVIAAIIGVLFFALAVSKGYADEHHHRHHATYQDWTSQKTPYGCCNAQDCADLKDVDYKQTNDGEFVRIEGQWCPVLPIHRLTKGKSPDWSVAHACVRLGSAPDNQCERLLCFVGRGGM